MIQRHRGFLIHHDELRWIVSHWKRFNAVVIGGRSNAMPASLIKGGAGDAQDVSPENVPKLSS
jgi:hypothetical protein